MSQMSDYFFIGDVVEIRRDLYDGSLLGRRGQIIKFDDKGRAEVLLPEGDIKIYALPSSLIVIDDEIFCPCDRPFDYKCFSCIEMMYP